MKRGNKIRWKKGVIDKEREERRTGKGENGIRRDKRRNK